MVRIIALGDVLPNHGQILARVVVERDPDERAGRIRRLLDEAANLAGRIDVHDAVLAGLLKAPHVIHPQHRTLLRAAIVPESTEALVEEVVTGHHDQVVVQILLFEHQVQVADGPQFVGIVGRSVIDHRKSERVLGGFAVGLRPLRELACELGVAHHEHLVDAPDRGQIIHDIVDHGFARDRQQRLGLSQRQRIQPRGITGGKDEHLHGWVEVIRDFNRPPTKKEPPRGNVLKTEPGANPRNFTSKGRVPPNPARVDQLDASPPRTWSLRIESKIRQG